MKKYKTIDEVIRKGQILVNVPVMIIMVIVPIVLAIGIPMVIPEKYEGAGILIGLFGGMGLGFLLAWTWWSFSVAKWRIWAFENTKKSDWKALKSRAIKGKLIWEDGSKFEKTEIRNKEEQIKIEKINSEIGELESEISLDEINDDPSIPIQSDFYFKRSETIMSLILPLVFITAGFYVLSSGGSFIIGLIAIGLGIYFTDLNKIKNITKEEVQFSISNEGIDIKKFKQFGFVKWENTENITIDTDNGVLRLGIWEEEDFYEVTYSLSEYQIGNYDEFLRIINVYLKRNLKKENDS